ncbi:hypothetical protein [Grimontia marina]|uniref:Glutarate-semialdehyde dehydrogenase DavD n=1 Tax=Grimontia marina TaxID=646534 RepID=A0A128FHQ4_9GAMM|nr:hypothetical protein [Grimontia marina]CZF85791.1 Glutarate-semialdehyde dehydrogenase DavD [Grimontia marina]
MTLIRDKAFIGGDWVDSESGKTYPVFDPAYTNIIAHVPEMGKNETKYVCFGGLS